MLRAYLDIELRQCRTVNFPATVGPTLVEACSVAVLARLEPLRRNLGGAGVPFAESAFLIPAMSALRGPIAGRALSSGKLAAEPVACGLV